MDRTQINERPKAENVMSENQSQLKSWLLELGNQQGTHFNLDEEGRCFISANGKSNLNIYGPASSDNFYINVELLSVPAEGAELMFRTALGLNLFQQETRGTAIALDEQSSMLMLCYSGNYNSVTFQDFCNTINNMIELSENVMLQLADATLDSSSKNSVDSNVDMPAFGILC